MDVDLKLKNWRHIKSVQGLDEHEQHEHCQRHIAPTFSKLEIEIVGSLKLRFSKQKLPLCQHNKMALPTSLFNLWFMLPHVALAGLDTAMLSVASPFLRAYETEASYLWKRPWQLVSSVFQGKNVEGAAKWAWWGVRFCSVSGTWDPCPMACQEWINFLHYGLGILVTIGAYSCLDLIWRAFFLHVCLWVEEQQQEATLYKT